MSQHHDVAVEDVGAAIDFVIRNGAQDRGQTISYSRFFTVALIYGSEPHHIQHVQASITRAQNTD